MCDQKYLHEMCEECQFEVDQTDHGEQVAIRIQEWVNKGD